MVSTLLGDLASYGFTVIASASGWTGSGTQIDAAAHYLSAQDTTVGSVFYHKLDAHKVAAIGHSQGAGGAVRAATHDPALITAVLTQRHQIRPARQPRQAPDRWPVTAWIPSGPA